MTADRTYLLFTEVAGMVFATARSAREERSKQRYALQDFAHVRVSLVKGKGGWRIGSVEAITNYYLAAPDRAVRGTVVGVVQFLRRLLTGEESQPAVFIDTVAILSQVLSLSPPELGNVFDRYRLRTLAHLGYVASHTAYTELLEPGSGWLHTNQPLPGVAVKAIEQGLVSSQL